MGMLTKTNITVMATAPATVHHHYQAGRQGEQPQAPPGRHLAQVVRVPAARPKPAPDDAPPVPRVAPERPQLLVGDEGEHDRSQQHHDPQPIQPAQARCASGRVTAYSGRQPRYTMIVGKRWMPTKLTGQ